ncbi:hypothetical protein WJX72_001429 [[Myrmecia] bisecta]|uniref:Ubiquitin carboxyl-terminal hydrolase n=1 Tax=[Myrmecia] bisecta TaxID=41462 RepID=A0AAW1PPT3_9CHLO
MPEAQRHRSLDSPHAASQRQFSGAFDTASLRYSLSGVASETDSPMSASGYRPATKARKVDEASSSYGTRAIPIRRSQTIPENPPIWRRSPAEASTRLGSSSLRSSVSTRSQAASDYSATRGSPYAASGLSASAAFTSRTTRASTATSQQEHIRSERASGAASMQSYHTTHSSVNGSSDFQTAGSPLSTGRTFRSRPAIISVSRIAALRSPAYKRDSQGRLQRDSGLPESTERSSSHSTSSRLLEQHLSSTALVKLPSGKGTVGLENLGNTCFLNSILQCLTSIPELVQYFLQGDSAMTSGSKVASAYAALVLKIWQAQSGDVVSPSKFLSQVSSWDRRWGNGRQHDAQEFLHSLLEALQLELNRHRTKPPYKELRGTGTEADQADEAWQYAQSWHSSVIDDTFGGQLQSTLECQDCHTKSHCFDYFLDLSLPLPQARKEVTIQDCLDAFTENSTPVAITTEGLDLSRYCSIAARKNIRKPVYDLIAISHHSGSLGGGHYTAQCKSAADGRWLDFNDSFVSGYAEPRGTSSSAYVLFYRQRGI